MDGIARVLSLLFDFLFPLHDTAERVRDASHEQLGTLVSPSITPSGVHTLLPYRHPLVRAVIIEAKFKRNPKAIALLASLLKDYVAGTEEETVELGGRPSILVPVPLGPERRRERGYNQVEEIVRASGLPFDTSLLIRSKDTKPQTSLSRTERLHNMEDAFQAAGPANPAHTYIVVDDVMTTGATLLAAQSALSKEGIESMSLALAH